MPVAPLLTEEELDALRQFDTCMIANAIESFNVRLRNTGFADASVRCMFEDAPPMVGYAVTARLRSGEPPIGGGTFHDRADFWNTILAVPAPRILVLEDMDDPPGRGAFVGDMHAAILKGLGCVGYVTNGAVRELPSVRKMGDSVVRWKCSCFPRLRPHLRDWSRHQRGWNGSATWRLAARGSPRCADGSGRDCGQRSRRCGPIATGGAKGHRFLSIKGFLSGEAARGYENAELGNGPGNAGQGKQDDSKLQ